MTTKYIINDVDANCMFKVKCFTQDRQAITGFFEEIPVLVIVTVAILIFFFGVVSAVVNHQELRGEIEFTRDAIEFTDAIKSYEGLLHNNQRGVFDANKIRALTPRAISEALHPNYNYRIQIVDLGDYPQKFNCDIRSAPMPSPYNPEATCVVISSINIWVSEEEIHPGRLIVTIWKR
jgi:hypothetical protein